LKRRIKQEDTEVTEGLRAIHSQIDRKFKSSANDRLGNPSNWPPPLALVQKEEFSQEETEELRAFPSSASSLPFKNQKSTIKNQKSSFS
jgi:hypothetical protein